MLKIPFLIGKIKLDIGNKREFNRGEIIKGKVYLTLKRDVEARGVKVRLIAEKEVQERKGDETIIRWKEFYRQEAVLDGEKKYKKGNYEYEFELKIPESAPPTTAPPLLRISISGMSFSTKIPIRWKIAAVLDIPLGLDLSDKKDIILK